jgi:DNA-binding NtrC family response regulator
VNIDYHVAFDTNFYSVPYHLVHEVVEIRSPASLDAARDLSEQAANLLKNEVQDHIWEDLQTLKTKVVRGGTLVSTLHAWSQGVVGDRTFQQLTEDFADLIISKIWEHERRKVARVARRLSISPKKVRRVLARLGLHGARGARSQYNLV